MFSFLIAKIFLTDTINGCLRILISVNNLSAGTNFG